MGVVVFWTAVYYRIYSDMSEWEALTDWLFEMLADRQKKLDSALAENESLRDELAEVKRRYMSIEDVIEEYNVGRD
jgi:hypothetical protein